MKKAIRSMQIGVIAAVMGLGLSTADASTVAYWEFDSGGLVGLLGDAVGSYDLTQTGGGDPVGASGLLGENPLPNPDTSATFTGGAAAAAENLGSAYLAGGVSRYMYNNDADALLNLGGASSWTVEGWFQLNAMPGGVDTLFSTRNDATGVGILVDVRESGANAVLSVYAKDGANVSTWNTYGAGDIVTGTSYTFHHYALTYANGTFEVFLDGVSKGTQGTAGMNLGGLDIGDGDTLRVMGRSASTSSSLGGRIDEWRISDQVLGTNEMLNIPEPATMGLVGLGSLLVMASRRFRK